MNYLDIISLLLLLFFFYLGFKRGFFLSFLQLVGIVLVIVLIRQFGLVIREGIHHQLGISYTWAIVLGYLAIFIIIMVLAKLLSYLLQKLMAMISLGWINRLLGGIFNLLFGFAIIVVLVLIIEVSSLSDSLGEARDHSRLYSYARGIATDIIDKYTTEIPGSRPSRERPPQVPPSRPL